MQTPLFSSTSNLNIETYYLFPIGNMARTKQTPRNPVLERLHQLLWVATYKERECLPNPPLRKQLKEGSNPANICYTKLQVESKSHIDIVLDC